MTPAEYSETLKKLFSITDTLTQDEIRAVIRYLRSQLDSVDE